MKSVIVVGTGPGWSEELAVALEHCPDADIMAVNKAIQDSPVPITYAATKHPEHLPEWLDKREDVIVYSIYSSQYKDYITEVRNFPEPWMEMTSGMYAVKCAIDAEYDKIFLAGLPLNPKWLSARTIRTHLQNTKDEFQNVVVPDHYWWKEFVCVNTKI